MSTSTSYVTSSLKTWLKTKARRSYALGPPSLTVQDLGPAPALAAPPKPVITAKNTEKKITVNFCIQSISPLYSRYKRRWELLEPEWSQPGVNTAVILT